MRIRRSHSSKIFNRNGIFRYMKVAVRVRGSQVYVVGYRSFRSDQLIKVTKKTNLIFFNIASLYFNTLFNWYINLTIDGTIYPSQYFPFDAAFVCQVGNFWTLLRIRTGLCAMNNITTVNIQRLHNKETFITEQLKHQSFCVKVQEITETALSWYMPSCSLVLYTDTTSNLLSLPRD